MKESAFANPNCILTNSSGAYGVTIAEHIMGVTLMMMRGLLEFAEETRAGKWSTPRLQRSIKDCRIMVLGTGDIGRAFAARAKAFEPEAIIGVCRSGNAPARLFNRVVKIDEIEKWLPRADLLVMSLPDTPQTVNILSRKRINMLSQGAYVVNVGRGSAIDEDALADALEEGRLGGAALDVFRTEPLPENSRMWKTKNLLITPHVAGGLTLDYTLDKNVEMFCEDLRNYAEKRPLLHRVSRKKGY